MQYHRIPHSSLEVSTLGLGTMTFGEQNSEADAHAQLDYCLLYTSPSPRDTR